MLGVLATINWNYSIRGMLQDKWAFQEARCFLRELRLVRFLVMGKAVVNLLLPLMPMRQQKPLREYWKQPVTETPLIAPKSHVALAFG